MLRLILGRAGTGKTTRIMQEIRDLAPAEDAGAVPCILIVPEQYSHEAERELCRVCGDRLSLYAEVLSFTRLAHTVAVELGGSARRYMDQGGRLLCMALALDASGAGLQLFGSARRQPALQKSLLDTLTELKSARIAPSDLSAAAGRVGGILGGKLRDLSLIMEAYEAAAVRSGADPGSRLDELAERLKDSSRLRGAKIFVDGFTDFTAQERQVLRAMTAAADVTVCLTCDSLSGGSEVFDLSREAAQRLLRAAREDGVPESVEFVYTPDRSGVMEFLEQHLFSYTDKQYAGAGQAVTLWRAPGVSAECELAAARILTLVRETGCRWRDIAVAVRGFEAYRPALESVFARYGIPLYLSRKSDILQKPLPTLLTAAFAIIGGGWAYEDVFAYLKTGLVGITAAECDVLENYVLLWSLRGGAWTRTEPWRQHPDGFGGLYDEETEERLRGINELRRRIAAPLRALQERGEEAATAREQAEALCAFLEEIGLAERLDARAAALESTGMETTAAEYTQLWELLCTALEQCAQVLGETPMEQDEFARLLQLVLSQYDVGTIPVALDRVSAGDMDRMRRRHIRHLFVLGASNERLPLISEGGGVLSDSEREELRELCLELGGGREALSREFSLIYNCLTLPSDSLYMSYADENGSEASLPSFVMDRLRLLFGREALPGDLINARSSAREPAMELAASAAGDSLSVAVRQYWEENKESAARLRALRSAANRQRGRLGADAVRSLYGDTLRLSASRVDAFSSCRFAYFLQYGLKAKPRVPASFAPPEYGSFLHYVLAHVAAEAAERGGFGRVDDEALAEMTDRAVQLYVRQELDDFREKSPRFVYLFRRLGRTVRRVVLDMAEELRVSDFQPLDFELNFAQATDLPPVALGEGEDALYLTGVADRVDGWEHDGKLYIRVVDYKTGKKSFSLSDVWYGMGLQMLLYLFTLEKSGSHRYGRQIVPAGVLYVPARDAILSRSEDLDDAELIREKAKEKRRSGLLLNDPAVLAAMERGEIPKYLPITVNREGHAAGESLADAAQLAQLSRHIDRTLQALAAELRRGSIAADPYFRSQQENACQYCDFVDACHFDPESDQRRFLTKLRSPEIWARLEGGEEHV